MVMTISKERLRVSKHIVTGISGGTPKGSTPQLTRLQSATWRSQSAVNARWRWGRQFLSRPAAQTAHTEHHWPSPRAHLWQDS